MKEQVVETDVLVIGGGIAGCFAAIKAKEKGVNVTLVDKGYVSRSGQTPYASSITVFNPEWGHNLDEWVNQVNVYSEYINNRTWTEIMFKDSYARFQDLVSWGTEFQKDENSPRPHKFRIRYYPVSGAVTETLFYEGHFPYKYAQVLREHAVKSGVEILDKTMITDLIKEDGRVVGAVGMPMGSSGSVVFKAKATIICTGASGFKLAIGARALFELTADGHAMAYRVGAEIAGKEFVDPDPVTDPLTVRSPRPQLSKDGQPVPRPPRGKLFNAEGNEMPEHLPAHHMFMEYDVHAGRAPLSRDQGGKKVTVHGREVGRSNHISDGIWPVDTKCASSVPGLYAAGDSCGTYVVGAVYPGVGFSTAFCSATGTRAGEAAAEYATQFGKLTVSDEAIERVEKVLFAPLERKGGFTPAWVTQMLQNLMLPYYILEIKHEDRMKAALTTVEFMRDHLVPKIYAETPHGLRLAHETKSMVLNAEMKLQASLFRTESRGNHYREDFPRREDPEWLAWVLLKEEDGQMKAIKKSIPEEWHPDLSKPYKDRYLYKFPGE